MTDSSKPRVGVLTYHNGPNFGGFMQAWHLVQAIRSLGYNAHAVNYLHQAHDKSNEIKIPLKNLSSLKANIFWALKKRGFRNIEKELCCHDYTTDSSKVPWDEFDAIVVGSDIVWDYQNSEFGHDPAYFGDIPQLKDKPMIAYAASCGPADPEGPFPDYIKDGLERFVSIGVRDGATARLVKNASGLESEIVVDPTWLGDDPSIRWAGLPSSKYLFAYGGHINPVMGSHLKSYCEEHGLQLVSALTSNRHADKMYRTLTPFQWVQLFENSEATAIVGTLHGTLFTMKYGRPFVLVNSPAISPKIAQILDRTSQNFRLFEPDTITREDLSILDPANAEPPCIPSDWLLNSQQFLANSLQEALGGL